MTAPRSTRAAVGHYDGFLLVSFGGPEGPDEVLPFLERVTAGRNVPAERLQSVAKVYFDRGGVSPINAHCRTLLRDLTKAFPAAGIDLPLYWANRNSPPFLEETISQMRDDGVERALAFVTSAYSSYSGCRQYRENIATAQDRVDPGAPAIEKLRVFFNHPGFVEPLVDGLRSALAQIALDAGDVHVLFTAHSIPASMAYGCLYQDQLTNTAELVAARVEGMPDWSLVWQSRSGPAAVPWLEPDICDAIAQVEGRGVVVVPLGFVADHMEVIQDLDTEAAAVASAAGLAFVRVPTSGSDPRFVEMIVSLVSERVHGAKPVALGALGLFPEQCAQSCCLAPSRPGSPTGDLVL